MEGIRKHVTVSFFGARKNIGTETIALNIAVEFIKKKLKVMYGNSPGSETEVSYLYKTGSGRTGDDFYSIRSDIDGLNFLCFSEKATQMSPQKIEELLVDMPEKISQTSDYFFFNIKDPFAFPDRYILLHTDIHILAARLESTIFSDIFQLFEKLAFMPAKPEQFYLIFNNTRDLDRAFETYLQLVRQAEQMKINIKLYFLGIVPGDLLRQNLSRQMNLPLNMAFPDSAFKGAVSFISEKLIVASKNINMHQLPTGHS